jgi:hypothetical protein
MAVKLVDKVLSFMGFEEEAVEEDTKFNREEEPEEQPWRRKRDRFREWIKLTLSIIFLTLLVCRRPIKCHSTPGGNSLYLDSNSCALFSPRLSKPRVSISLMISTGTVLVTATSFT